MGGGRAGGVWAGRVHVPILLRGAVSGLGGPEGPGRLVEGGAGCKGVPRGVRGGGQGLGGDRAGREGRGGDLARVGCPPGAERTGEDCGAPAPPPHIWPEATGKGRLGFQGAHLGAMISAHAARGRGRTSAACSTGRREADRQTDRQADTRGTLTVRQPPAQLPVPRLPIWPPPSTPGQGWGYQGCTREGRSARTSNPTPPAAQMSQAPHIPSAVCSEAAGP